MFTPVPNPTTNPVPPKFGEQDLIRRSASTVTPPAKRLTEVAKLIDVSKCIGCKACQKACPYGAPQYSAAAGAMLKCDGCRDRVAEGKKPVCVEACPLRALDLLPIDELRKKYGSLSEVAPLKPAHLTRPALSLMPGKRTRPQGDKAGFIANPKEV